MKIRMFLLLAGVAVTTSCAMLAKVEYESYVGKAEFKGEGGTLKTIDGIPFWNDGLPDHDFRIIGIINTSLIDSPFLYVDQTHDIAKLVKQHGGDAVVIKERHYALTCGDPKSPQTVYTKWMVVKYIN